MTVRHPCDGPSCHSVTKFKESFPVPNSQELKCFETADHDDSSCLWRSVLQVRHRVQRVDSQYPIFRISKCFKTRPLDCPSCPWRSVVCFVISACFSRNKICCSKRLNRSLQLVILHIHLLALKYPLTSTYWLSIPFHPPLDPILITFIVNYHFNIFKKNITPL